MAEKSASFTSLVRKRASVKSQLTIFRNFLNKITNQTAVSQMNVVDVQTRLDRAEQLIDDFNSIQIEIEQEIDDSKVDAEMKERESFDESYYEAISIAKQLISHNAGNSSTSNADASNSSVGLCDSVKLPTISLPKFDGEYENWLEFRDTFQSLINSRGSMSKIQKYHYLKASLVGKAAGITKTVGISDEAYDTVWQALCDRFDNNRKLKQNHLNALCNLKVKCTSEGLRQLIDDIGKHVRSLELLKEPVEHWDTILIHIIAAKLEVEMRCCWEEDRPGDSPTLDEFKRFLSSKADTLETKECETRTSMKSSVTNHRPQKVLVAVGGKCVLCQGEHTIHKCSDFIAMSVNERCEQVKKHKLCGNCLRAGHIARDCRSTNCRKCSGRHSTLLHFPRSNERDNPQLRSNVESLHSTAMAQEVLLSTAVVNVRDVHGKLHKARALLDVGSQSSFMTSKLHSKLQLPYETVNLQVGGFSQTLSSIKRACVVEMSSTDKKFKSNLRCLITAHITKDIPAYKINRSSLNIPSNIFLADPNFDAPREVDVLIGAELFWELLCVGRVSAGSGSAILQKTRLGWIIGGAIESTSSKVMRCHFSQHTSLDSQVHRLWEVESCPTRRTLSVEEKCCEEHYVANTTRQSDGRFVVKIPLKGNIKQLGESKSLAERRFFQLERKLIKNPSMYALYRSFMSEYIALGHMRKSDDSPEVIGYYMPHHGVLKQESLTTKLRVVFDGSAKTSSGVSINDLQMVGPTIQQDQLSILLRFRKHAVVVCADIEKMYRQVAIVPEHMHLQRILWRDSPAESVSTYELTTVTYGTAAASFLAIRSLFQLGIDNEVTHPSASKVIKSDFYVDDLITGSDSIEDLSATCGEISSILSAAGFSLRKWISNKPEIVSSLIQKNDSPHVINIGDSDSTKTLGLFWENTRDVLFYKISPPIKLPATKRTMLSEIAQIFDPLGLLAPSTVLAKMLIQEVWSAGVSWDESLPLSLDSRWKNYRSELPRLNELRVLRNVMISGEYDRIDLHGFSDASEGAYGAAVYVRTSNQAGHVNVNLLTAKTRVAPLKTLSIPRLELCGAVLLAQLTDKVLEALQVGTIKVTYWTDSTIVLGWIRQQPRNLQVFVGNRIAEIQELTVVDAWKHVPSQENPADLASRGVRPGDLQQAELWWHGPQWLQKGESCWPVLPQLETHLPETKAKISVLATAVLPRFPFERFSSFTRLKRVAAYILRFRHNCKCKERKDRRTKSLSVAEVANAELHLIRAAQEESFPDEMKHLRANQADRISKSLQSLAPFIDERGNLRVGGRLLNSSYEFDKKHPFLISSNHPLTKLIFVEMHTELLHAGPQMLLSSVRDSYWPIGGRNLARRVCRTCVKCFKANPVSAEPLMGQLPPQRVKPSSPFEVTGVDYAGPMSLKDRQGRGCKISKVYIALFVCFCSKAVHLELVSALSTESFMAAFGRFVARRGLPSEVFSDNGTNFVGANNELRALAAFLTSDAQNIIEQAAVKNVKWHFIPPRSPHFGGLWEAGVKSTKSHLRRVAANALLTYEQLYTLLTSIEAILNSRPVCPLSPDPNDLTALTPAHFLIGRKLTSLPNPDLQCVPENRLKAFQRVVQIKQHFWARWSKEYVSELQQRVKWRSAIRDMKLNDLVIVKEDNTPVSSWRLGRIEELHPGADGVVRVVTVRTNAGRVKRGVTKICILPTED